ncbi:MAG TPA: helix-turn-helix domain-containing protein [Chloroflexia bacterium]|jgi:excisionase family DNA binding protein
MASTTEHEPIAASVSEEQVLAEIERLLLMSSQGQAHSLVGPNGEAVQLPHSVLDLLQQIVRELRQGHAVSLVSLDRELTTQQAADLLNVSRPYLIKLLEEGRIPYIKTGTHRRVGLQALMEYKAQRDEERRCGLALITQMSEEMGLSD